MISLSLHKFCSPYSLLFCCRRKWRLCFLLWRKIVNLIWNLLLDPAVLNVQRRWRDVYLSVHQCQSFYLVEAWTAFVLPTWAVLWWDVVKGSGQVWPWANYMAVWTYHQKVRLLLLLFSCGHQSHVVHLTGFHVMHYMSAISEICRADFTGGPSSVVIKVEELKQVWVPNIWISAHSLY